MQDAIKLYPENRERLDTFTIINCEHKDLFWRLIGHTAILYKYKATGQLMVFESTTLNKYTGNSGVQLTPFGLWLAHYPGKVYARTPEFQDSRGDGKDYDYRRIQLAEAFIKTHLGTSYPDLKTWSGKMKLILSALDFRLFGVDLLTYKGDDKGIFCTELVIMLLQYCGIVTQMMSSYAAYEYEPDDTRGNKEKFEDELLRCRYGKEVRLK